MFFDNVKCIAASSDGLDSFVCNHGMVSIDNKVIMREFMYFKSMTGEFVKRRLNALQRDCIKRGWTHTDDISMAALNFVGE